MTAETSLPTCYRHEDRETRLSCSRCERPICVDCVRSASVGQLCPECAAEGQQRIIRSADLQRPSSGAPVTMTVLAICVGLFLLTFVPSVQELIYFFGVQANVFVAAGEWWRLFTAAFLHGGLTHILFNMWALYVLGPQLERQVGSAAFFTLYIASALVGGTAFYILVPGGQAVGASGAIFGLFGSWLVAAYSSRHTIAGRQGFRQMLTLLAINLALPLIVPGIAWQAHIGGLVAGGAITFAWMTPSLRGRGRQVARVAVAVAVGLAALAVVALV